jgi:hypothetical protein
MAEGDYGGALVAIHRSVDQAIIFRRPVGRRPRLDGGSMTNGGSPSGSGNQRWEPWHFGLATNPSSAPALSRRRDGDGSSALPAFVPEQYVDALSRAAQRWNVSATLLAAQLQRESGFNPFAVSVAGARGIAQFMPATAAAYGLVDPTDATAAIDAQAHLMRDLLRQFGSVALALAAYNAGPDRVMQCGCVPPIPETTAYVAAILGLMGGAGDAAGLFGLTIRLVR